MIAAIQRARNTAVAKAISQAMTPLSPIMYSILKICWREA
jgi:uncharacterized protein YggE